MMARLRENIGKRILYRKKKVRLRETLVHNFDTAKSAIILFETNDPDSFPVIKEFRNFIKNKGISCTAYGIVQQKEIPQEMLFWKSYSFITRGDLTWYMKPRGEVAERFYSSEPDLLIDFTFSTNLEIQYLVHLSMASFKIGCFTEQENDYDLMINPTSKCDIGFFADQVKHYVSMLNPSK